MLLIVKILNCFIIHQTIHRLSIGTRIKSIHLMTMMHTPFSHQKCKSDIKHNSAKNRNRKLYVILAKQNARNENKLCNSRHNAKN